MLLSKKHKVTQHTIESLWSEHDALLAKGAGAKTFAEWFKLTGLEEGWEPTQEPEPTNLIPGTPEKIEILRKRHELGQKLFHTDDPFLIED